MEADSARDLHSASTAADCSEFTKHGLLPTALSWDRLGASTRAIAEDAMAFLDECAAEEKARGPHSFRDCKSAKQGVASAPKLATDRDQIVLGNARYSKTDARLHWAGTTPSFPSRNGKNEMLGTSLFAGRTTGALKSGLEWQGATSALPLVSAGSGFACTMPLVSARSGFACKPSTPPAWPSPATPTSKVDAFLSMNATKEMLGTSSSAGTADGAFEGRLEWQGTAPSLLSGEMVRTLTADGLQTSGHHSPPQLHRSRSYLTEADAITIFLAKRSVKGQRSSLGSRLAVDFGITSKAVRDIWKMRTWRKTTEPFWNAEERQRAAATRQGNTPQ